MIPPQIYNVGAAIGRPKTGIADSGKRAANGRPYIGVRKDSQGRFVCRPLGRPLRSGAQPALPPAEIENRINQGASGSLNHRRLLNL